MKKNIFYLYFFLLFPVFSIASSINDDPKRIFEKAEQYLIDENYSAALPLYLKLDSINKGNADINFKIGFCYLNSATYKTKAIPYFETASKNISNKYTEGSRKETAAPISAIYYLAKAYQLNYEWDKAIATYEQYLTLLGTDSKNAKDVEDTQHNIATCKFGKEAVTRPINVIITSLGGKVNSAYPDYSPVVSLDEQTLIFTSRRKGGVSQLKEPNGQYSEDIYISKFINGEWDSAKSISPNINTAKYEATINLSADGQKLLLYKDENKGNIFISELHGNEWGIPQMLDIPANGTGWVSHACFTSDNNTLYFVSNRQGGYGGKDIYKCLRLPNGKWGTPQNLGDQINTKYDEDGVFIHPDGKQIFFASKGHQSMGGFDIFTSTISDENGFWSQPVNYGYPVNTPDDDLFFITSVDGKRAYFSSDKEGGYGEKDLYRLDFPEYLPRNITVLIGQVVSTNNSNLDNNEIIIINTTTKDTLQILNANSKTGKYGINLPVGYSYNTIYKLNGKEFFSEIVNAPNSDGYNVITREIPCNIIAKPVKPDQNNDWFSEKNDNDKIDANTKDKDNSPCNIEQLYFEVYFKYNQQDSDDKHKEFNAFCDKLKSCMLSNPNLIIEIEASASKVPTSKYKTNERLVVARSSAAEQKLIRSMERRGIKKSQLHFNKPYKEIVQGPEYKKDSKSNKAIYESYQYVKLKASVKK